MSKDEIISESERLKLEKLGEAVNTLIEALENDPDYRIAWQANIAMAFYDNVHWNRVNGKRLMSRAKAHEIGNQAAEHFLKLLCRKPIDNA